MFWPNYSGALISLDNTVYIIEYAQEIHDFSKVYNRPRALRDMPYNSDSQIHLHEEILEQYLPVRSTNVQVFTTTLNTLDLQKKGYRRLMV